MTRRETRPKKQVRFEEDEYLEDKALLRSPVSLLTLQDEGDLGHDVLEDEITMLDKLVCLIFVYGCSVYSATFIVWYFLIRNITFLLLLRNSCVHEIYVV